MPEAYVTFAFQLIYGLHNILSPQALKTNHLDGTLANVYM